MKKKLSGVAAIALVVIVLMGHFFAPVHAAGLSGCGPGSMATQTASGGPLTCQGGMSMVRSVRTVNLAATGDQGTIAIPAGITKYAITGVSITNCSDTPVLAQPAIYSAAAGGGNNIVAAATVTGASSTAVVLSSVLATTNTQTAAILYVRIIVANVGALTCDFYVAIQDLT